MLYTQCFFISLCLSYLGSFSYLVYFFTKYNTINQKGKLAKFIFKFVLTSVSIIFIIGFIIYIGYLNINLALLTILASFLYVMGLLLIFGDASYFFGLILIFISITLMGFLYTIDEIETRSILQTKDIELYTSNIDNNNNNNLDMDLEDLLVIVDIEDESSDSESSSSVKINTILYDFKQYNKKDLEEFDLKEFPVLVRVNLEDLTYDKEEKLEIIKNEIQTHSLFSYFGFTKPKTQYCYEYKAYIDKTTLKFGQE